MSEFNLDPYFAAQDEGVELQEDPISKWETLNFNTTTKQAELSQKAEEKRRALHALTRQVDQEKAAFDKSWVGQADLDPDSVAGGAVNLAASLTTGTGRIAGELVTLPSDTYSAAQDFLLPTGVREAYSRIQQGTATPEDHALMDQSNIGETASAEPKDPSGPTWGSRIEEMQDARHWAEEVSETFDLYDNVEMGNRQELSRRLAEGSANGLSALRDAAKAYDDNDLSGMLSDGVYGIASLLVNAGPALLENPGAVAEYTVEMAPQIASAMVSRGLVTPQIAGYAAKTYRDGVLKYQEENGGALPSKDKNMEMATHAVSLFVAEKMGLESIGRAGKLFNKGSKSKPTPKKNAVDTPPKAKKEAKGVVGIAGSSARGFAGESGTETWQTYAEGVAGYDPRSAEQIYEGGVIGGAVGGTISGAGKTVSEIDRAVKGTDKAKADTEAEIVDMKAATESGDISAYTDKKSPKYDLNRAAAVLKARQENGDTKAVDEINKVYRRAEKDVAVMENTARVYTPEGKAENERKLAEQTQALKEATDPAEKAKLQKAIQTTKMFIDANGDKKGKKDTDATLARAKETFKNVSKVQEEVTAETVAPKDSEEDLATLKTKANLTEGLDTEVSSEERQAAVQKLTTQTMSSPSILSSTEADTLVNDTTNGLNDSQREYLREFSRAQESLQGVSGTNSDIFKGRDGYRGIPTYRNLIQSAMKDKDTEAVQGYMGDLQRFARDHQSKANAVEAAFNQWQTTKQPQSVVRGKTAGTWAVSKEPMSKSAVKANGGLTIDGKSSNLVQAIKAESKALNAAGIEMTAMSKMTAPTRKPASQKGTSNESTPPKTPEAKTPADYVAETPTQKPVTDPAPDEAGTENVTTYDGWAKANAGKRIAIQYPKSKTPFTVTVSEETEVVTEGNEGQRVAFTGVTSKGKKVTFTEADVTNYIGATEIEPGSLSNIRGESGQQPQAAEPAPLTPNETVSEDVVSPEVTEESDGLPVEEVAKAPGSLSTMQFEGDRPVADQSNFKSVNLAQAYYTQSAGKEEGGGTRPLVDYDRFLTAVRAKIEVAKDYFNTPKDQDEEVTSAQRRALETFAEKAAKWMPTLDKIMRDYDKLPADASWHWDVIQYFRDPETGQLPENMKGAIAYAAWTFLVESEAASPIMSDEDIRTILGLDDHEQVPPAAKQALQFAGTRANMMVNNVGPRARKVLGIKAVASAPLDAEPKLDAALGSYAQGLLLELGLIERPKIEYVGFDQDTSFVRIKREDNKARDAIPEIAEIGRVSRGTQNYLDKLMGSEAVVQEPVFETPYFTQKTTKGTDSRIPENMVDMQQINTSRGWKVRPWMNGLWQALTDETQEAAAGVVDTEGEHRLIQSSLEGSNAGLIREIKQFRDFLDTGIRGNYEKKFFLHPSVWVMQRAGYKNTINPQNSKVQRELIGMADWSVRIPTDFRDPLNKLFRQNVAMGLGIKADKLKQTETIKQLNSKLKHPKIRTGLEAIKKQVREEELTEGDQANIRDAVAKGGEGMQSLSALLSYARMEMAREPKNKAVDFDTDMDMMEVDGVTNGPMLTLLMLGAAQSTNGLFTFLNKGGMYQAGSPYKNFVDYKKQGNTDLYETAIGETVRAIETGLQKKPQRRPAFEAVEYFKGGVGSIFDTATNAIGRAARNVIKTPLTGMMFGQSLNAGVSSMFEELTEDMYRKVSRINKDNYTTAQKKEELAEWAAAVNTLISNYKPERSLEIPANPTMKWALNFEFSKEQKAAMRRSFAGTRKDNAGTFGAAVTAAMEDQFSVFLENRQVLNQAAQASALLYIEVRDHLIELRTEEKIAAGDIATTTNQKGERVVLQDLNALDMQAIDEQLAPMAPVAHSALSSEVNDLGAGIYLPKTKPKLDFANTTYRQNIKYSKDVGGSKGISATAFKKVIDSPGVRSLIMMIHSSDAAISAKAYSQLAALNIHDANGLSIVDLVAGARNLNEATYNVMLNYSIPLELKNTLDRTLVGVHGMLDMVKDSPALQAKLKTVIEGEFETVYPKNGKPYEKQLSGIRLSKEQRKAAEFLGTDPLTYLLSEVYKTAYTSEYRKLDGMGQMIYLDQYAQEGGEFNVTQELRDQATRMKEDLEIEARGGKDAEGNLQSDKLVVKTKQQAEELYAAVAGRQAKPQTPDTEISSAEYGAALKDILGEMDKKIQDHYKETGEKDSVAQKARNTVATLAKYLNRGYSLDAALKGLFPQEGSVGKKLAWKRRLAAQVEDRSLAVSDPRGAPHSVIMNVMQFMTDNEMDPGGQVVSLLETMYQDGLDLKSAMKHMSQVDAAIAFERIKTVYNSHRATPYGELGSAVVEADQDLDTFLRSKSNMTAGDVMGYLKKRYANPKTNQERFYRLILGQVSRTVPVDLPVRYITRENVDFPAPEGNVTSARGWYEPAADNEHIGIKSPDFIHSAVQPEVLLHELVHRALAGITHKAQSLPKKAPEAKLVADLESLREASIQWLDSQGDAGLKARHSEALVNVHEFLAWGLTNARFQTEVLSQVTVEATQRRNGFITAMKRFINVATELLLGKTVRWQEQGKTMTTAMAELLSRSGGLYAAARKGGETYYKGEALRSQQSDGSTPVEQYSTTQIFDGLANMQRAPLDADYEAELRGVLTSLVSKLHGPYGTNKELVRERANYSTADVFTEALMGNMPFMSEVLGKPLAISEQEAFVIEQVEATTRASLNASTMAYRELNKLYRETRERLSARDFVEGDWATASAAEKQAAQENFEFIFRPEKTEGGTSNHLSKFAAMAIAYKPLRDLMDQQTAPYARTGRVMSLAGIARAVFDTLMNVLTGKLTKTFEGQKANEKLDRLVDQLVSVEAKRQASLARRRVNGPNMMTAAVHKANESIRAGASKAAHSSVVKNSRSGFVRAAGVTVRVVAGDRVEEVFSGIQKLRNKLHSDKEGVVASLVTEIRGANDTNKEAYEFARMVNKNEQYRLLTKNRTIHDVLGSFDEDGKYLTEEDTVALTRTVLRPDLSALAKEHDMEELVGMVRDEGQRERMIADYERQLLKLDRGRATYWITQGRDLGWTMVTGAVTSANHMNNAHNIIQEFGTPNANSVAATVAEQAIPLLDRLTSLYALRNTPKKDRDTAGEVMTRESRRGDASGVSMIIKLHQKLKDDALDQLFQGNPTHFTKGYTKEIYNPYKEVVIASGIEGTNLERMGARRSEPLRSDPQDPTRGEVKRIYTIDDGGLKQWVTGTFSFTGTRPKGTRIHSGITRADNGGFVHLQNKQMTQDVQADKAMEVAGLYSRGLGYDPAKSNKEYMAPLLSSQGDVASYRYLMHTKTRDTLLERDNRMEEILGAMAANVVDRVNTRETNGLLVQALYDQYQAEKAEQPQGFIEVSENSTDPEIRETYRLLPDDTKKAIVATWGRPVMMVRKDLFMMHFGYRKKSIADPFSKAPRSERKDNPDARGIAEEVFVVVAEALLGKKAALRLRRAEDVWQELVRMIKDFLVIKNMFTLIGNILSNISELVLAGVPMKDILKNQRIAVEGLMAYEKDFRKVETLKMMRDINHLDRPLAAIEDEIALLEDALARNPVRELVDAGLLQTIVEDVEVLDDQFSYKSKLTRALDSKTQWLPKAIKDAGKFAVMSHDTDLYKLLYKTTHMSDFVARYTLYEHAINRDVNPLSKEDAIQFVEEAFVNYDTPTHKLVQYLNDMGIIPFTKYYIRIQKILFRLYRENPARALMMVLFSNTLEMVPTIVESGFWNKLNGNMIKGGAFEFGDALTEALPINTALQFTR